MSFQFPRAALAAALAGVIAGITPAQVGQKADPQQDLIDKKEKKLASEFLKKAPWTTDFDAARAAAKKSGEVIFAYFTRSYAK